MNDIHKLIKFNKENEVFVIAEAGSNWKAKNFDLSLKRAKKLISVAAVNGADAIKFQTFNHELVYVKNAGKSKYLKKKGVKKTINEIFKENSMPYEMLPHLSKFCKQKNIIFMSTPFSVQDAKKINPYVKIHKVASYEINHIKLLEYLSTTKKPIILSTAASTYNEINFAIKKLKNNKIILLQCTAKYPAPIESMNLQVIPNLRKKYGFVVGLSDHSLDPIIAPINAVALGAKVIEKHFTLNKSFSGPDHSFALNPSELKNMIIAIRKSEIVMGNKEKRILKEEEELRKFATRSIQAIKKIKKDEILKIGINIDVLRPGNQSRGMEARFLNKINGKKSKRSYNIGQGILE
jgi:N,N'-diacetyllegionaminate synthase